MDVHVRGIDPEVWHALRVEAVSQGISVGRLIADLWADRSEAERLREVSRNALLLKQLAQR